MKVDWIVVGAGLTGLTFAERLATAGRRVLLVDQRDHLGGNTWDEYNDAGILEHKYGPHIFHTNSREIWDYLSRFTEWQPYFHKVLGYIEGQLVPLPFNLNSIDRLFSHELAARISEKLVQAYGWGARVPILKLRTGDDPDLAFLGDYIYKNVFEQYTIKQWGMRPEELMASVTARVPVVASRDDRYFNDTYQAMPTHGYNRLVRNMARHPNIRVMLNTRWADIAEEVQYERVFHTGAIDEYFGYAFGPLPYRSLRFETIHHQAEQVNPAAVINYPNEHAFTRITELKWLTGQTCKRSTTLVEYPVPHVTGETIAYYPIQTEANRAQFAQYEAHAREHAPQVMFAGRLGDYMYYNMDQAVARALSLFKRV